MNNNCAHCVLKCVLLAIILAIGESALYANADSSFETLDYAKQCDNADSMLARAVCIVEQMGAIADDSGETLLPPGTSLDSFELDENQRGLARLTLPPHMNDYVVSESRAAIIDRLFTGSLFPSIPLTGFDLQLRTGGGEYRSLGTFIPIVSSPSPQADQQDVALPPSLKSPVSGVQTALGGPSAHADGQPSGALSGVVVYVSAGHGWTAGTSNWYLQRGLLLNMVEDYGNLEQLNYFVNYLYNAGAVVVPFRPVGYQPIEIVLDNDDPGVTYTGTWTNSTTAAEYYENGVTTSGVRYRYTTSNTTETATARYTPTITTADFYPVYCWTRDNTDRVLQTYRIRHSGGTAVIRIDHQRVGKGWIWLGSYYFETGTGGYVEISNQANTVSTVVADAIRFGNGMGTVVGAGPGTLSGYSREEECSRYWAESEAGLNAFGLSSSIWDCCSDDGSDNVGTAARWAREMNRTDVNNDRWRRIYMEYHTNAAGCGSSTCSAKGTVALYNETNGTTNQLLYAQVTGQKLEADMKALQSQFEYSWGSRYPNTYHASFPYGAISTTSNSNEFDATILEVAFHDNVEDAANLRNAKVRDAVARSTLQGIITFLSNTSTFPGTQVPAVFPPEPPEKVQARHDGQGNIVVSWTASPTGPALGHAATGYRIYRSTNGYGFGDGVDAGNVLTATLADIPANTTTYLRIAAYNAGGESMPSRTMAVRHDGTGSSRVLLVDGYNRVSRHQNHIQIIPAGPMERPIARKVNSFDYAVQHAAALTANDITFDYAENTAVISGGTTLTNYSGVVWVLGCESSADKTFDATEQSLVTAYLNNGGGLFVTGSDVAYELDSLGAGQSFYRNTLRASYVADNAGTYNVSGAGGILADVGNFNFDPAQGAVYKVSSPDQIAPQSGAVAILNYLGGTGGTAGVQYNSGAYRVVLFGFPFETISAASTRTTIMQRVMDFILPPVGCPVPITGFEGYTDGSQVMFQSPRYSGSTSGHLATTPNSASVSSAAPAFHGSKVCKVDWAWLDTSPTRWLRLTTYQATNIPNPAIDLDRPVRLRLRLDSGSFRLSLGIRETGTDVPVGANGGITGTIEWIGADSVVSGGGPLGVLVTAQPNVWQTIMFYPDPDKVQPMTGNGILQAPNNKGVLEHLAFTMTDSAGPFTVYLDGFEQTCPPIITQQPATQQFCPDETVSLTVSATGEGSLSYRWQKNGEDLVDGGHYYGANTPTLTISAADVNDAGSYRCVVSNAIGSTTSDTALLTGGTVVVIIQQPIPQPVCRTAAAQFTVGVTGDGPLSYQWQKNGTNLANNSKYSGVDTTTLQITNVSPSEVGSYRCIVTGPCNSVTSDSATLTLRNATGITQQPAAKTVCEGGTATFTAAGSGDGSLTYQWQKNSVDLSNGGHYSGVATATLTVSSANADDAASYRCIVTAGCGSATTNQALLTVKAATLITQQPTNQAVTAGSNAQFSVVAVGDGTLTYQWKKDGVNLGDTGHVSGSTTSTLTITGADATDAGSYVCVVTAGCGIATSDAASLTISGLTCNTPKMDANGDLHVDAVDFDAFSACYNGPTNPVSGDCLCIDANGDQYVDAIDFDVFSACYNGPTNPPGCG